MTTKKGFEKATYLGAISALKQISTMSITLLI